MRRAAGIHVRSQEQKEKIMMNAGIANMKVPPSLRRKAYTRYRNGFYHSTQLAAQKNEELKKRQKEEEEKLEVARRRRQRRMAAIAARKRSMHGESPRTGLLPSETLVGSRSCSDIMQLSYTQKVLEHRKLSDYGVVPPIALEDSSISWSAPPTSRGTRWNRFTERCFFLRLLMRMRAVKRTSLPAVPVIREEEDGKEDVEMPRSHTFCQSGSRQRHSVNFATNGLPPQERVPVGERVSSGKERRRNSVFVKRGSVSMEPIKKIDLDEVYTVNKQLGTGRFGYIKLAEHKQSKQKIAIKFFPRPQTKQVDFIREYNYSFFLSPHQHIIDTYEGMCQTSDDSAFFFVQEFCPRASLREAVDATNQQGIGEENTRKVFAGILSAIEFMHNENLVHRNLKAENILLFDSHDFSKVKVTDFGLTRKVDSAVKYLEYVNSYHAPELCETVVNEVLTVNRSIDTWALGVIFFYCIRGRLPWQKASIMCKAYWEWEQWLKRKNPCLPKKWTVFSEKALKLFKKTLTPRAKDRWTAKDMRKCITKEKLLKSMKSGEVEYVYHPTDFGKTKALKDSEADSRKKSTLQHWISTTLSTMAEISEQVVSARDD